MEKSSKSFLELELQISTLDRDITRAFTKQIA
jgi:hypothetical protein